MQCALQPNSDMASAWRARVRSQPCAVAVYSKAGTTSFAELDAWSDHIAAQLQSLRVHPGALVAVLGERSLAAIAALLACVKCGVAYVPIEPHLPQRRREAMLADAEPQACLVLPSAASDATSGKLPNIAVDAIATLRGAPHEPVHLDPALPLYVLYTSGSSGAPKGVIGSQAGLLNRLEWMWRNAPFVAGERIAHRTNLGFVDSVAELWGALLQAVPVVLIEPAAVADVEQFIEVLSAQQVSRVVVVPALLRAVLSVGQPLAQRWSALRYCISSGEHLPGPLAREFIRAVPHCRLLNLYGMTEAAADATWHLARDSDAPAVPIGRPIDGMQAHLLDERLQPVTTGTAQLYLSGVGLSYGYHRRPAMTAASFLPNPDPRSPGTRIYATGDLALCNSDGELEYRGRADTQVKIRGHRIELAEIEATTLQHAAVAQCAVLIAPDADHLQLFVCPRPQTELAPAALKAYLAQRLPDYMLPSFVHVRAALPQLPNGKIDRQQLSAATAPRSLGGAAPFNATQRQVALVWQEMLRIEPPALGDSFLDLGGNSLSAGLTVGRLRGLFGIALGLSEFLDCADLAAVAQLIEQRARPAGQPAIDDRGLETVDF